MSLFFAAPDCPDRRDSDRCDSDRCDSDRCFYGRSRLDATVTMGMFGLVALAARAVESAKAQCAIPGSSQHRAYLGG